MRGNAARIPSIDGRFGGVHAGNAAMTRHRKGQAIKINILVDKTVDGIVDRT